MPLKVIGAGLPRTATLSLKRALEALDLGPCYHMTEVTANPPRAVAWADAIEAGEGGEPKWESIFAGFSSACDIPAVSHWRELAEYYPDAKVILTVRDADRWYESMMSTIFDPTPNPGRERMKAQPDNVRRALDRMFNHAFARFDGGKNRDAVIAEFHRHNEEVKQTLPAGRLLVHEAREGWEPMCKFLGIPVPSVPYPRTNAADDFGKGWMTSDHLEK